MTEAGNPDARVHPVATTLVLFALAWSIRWLFIGATPDSEWPYTFAFKGDSRYYLLQAASLQQGIPFELGLPLRPPGAGRLVAWLWDSRSQGDFTVLRQAWILMGAAWAPVLYLVTRRALGERVAIVAGAFTAVATGPLLLSAALSNETPYGLIATLSVGLMPGLRARESRKALLVGLWSVLQAAICLLRPEHVLFFAFGLAWTARGGRALGPVAFGHVAVGLAAFAAVLLPWQLSAHSTIEALNNGELTEQEQRRGAPRLNLSWSPEAQEQLMQLPFFARRSTAAFVEDTVRTRGRQAVAEQDLGILEEAYDYTPEPFDTWPFVALYGPMNFYLANHPASAGGFSREPLFAPPPLHGGASRYPPGLLAGLPHDLELSYPPHTRIVNHGYAMGFAIIRDDPTGWLGRVGGKLQRMWQGAAHGFGGYAAPLGLTGVRRRVDMVTAVSGFAQVWRAALLLIVLAGSFHALRAPAARPWILWAVARIVIVVLFFGYARHGALLVPSLGVVLGLLADRYWSKTLARAGLVVLVALVGAEVWRHTHPPEVYIDGAVLNPGGKDMTMDFVEDRQIELR